ncbi:hypothetical protein GP486_006662 [Trichoglossum hirsutum]|uniref:Uncharacterized protein n=1 Tax=Trichoglossum hirsutum TaxID=265104 RepID=A0A9P8L7A1_9PEZI|nr:hypothetical protein GP486_006662 [Trichoglossum hirsutum]
MKSQDSKIGSSDIQRKEISAHEAPKMGSNGARVKTANVHGCFIIATGGPQKGMKDTGGTREDMRDTGRDSGKHGEGLKKIREGTQKIEARTQGGNSGQTNALANDRPTRVGYDPDDWALQCRFRWEKKTIDGVVITPECTMVRAVAEPGATYSYRKGLVRQGLASGTSQGTKKQETERRARVGRSRGGVKARGAGQTEDEKCVEGESALKAKVRDGKSARAGEFMAAATSESRKLGRHVRAKIARSGAIWAIYIAWPHPPPFPS